MPVTPPNLARRLVAEAMGRALLLIAVVGSGMMGAGAFSGVATAHLNVGEAMFSRSQHVRSGPAQALSELIATFGLLAVIWSCSKTRPTIVPFAVAAYITGAYWFTSSTSFANPAVTLARTVTNTFAGIRFEDAPAFVVAQLVGAAAATVLFGWMQPAHLERR